MAQTAKAKAVKLELTYAGRERKLTASLVNDLPRAIEVVAGELQPCQVALTGPHGAAPPPIAATCANTTSQYIGDRSRPYLPAAGWCWWSGASNRAALPRGRSTGVRSCSRTWRRAYGRPSPPSIPFWMTGSMKQTEPCSPIGMLGRAAPFGRGRVRPLPQIASFGQIRMSPEPRCRRLIATRSRSWFTVEGCPSRSTYRMFTLAS